MSDAPDVNPSPDPEQPVPLPPRQRVSQKGKAYSPALKAAVRDAWASGLYASDEEICDAFGIGSSATISQWRAKNEPDDISWTAIREQRLAVNLEAVTEVLGESNAQATVRHLNMARDVQATLLAYVQGEKLELADGTTRYIPAVKPKSLEGVVTALFNVVKQERHLRGEPDIRVEHWVHLFGFVVGEVGKAFCAEQNLPPGLLDRFIAIFDEKVAEALQNVGMDPGVPALPPVSEED